MNTSFPPLGPLNFGANHFDCPTPTSGSRGQSAFGDDVAPTLPALATPTGGSHHGRSAFGDDDSPTRPARLTVSPPRTTTTPRSPYRPSPLSSPASTRSNSSPVVPLLMTAGLGIYADPEDGIEQKTHTTAHGFELPGLKRKEPPLFVGGQAFAGKTDDLKELGINYVISLVEVEGSLITLRRTKGIKTICQLFDDGPLAITETKKQELFKLISTITELLKVDPHNRILIHCQMGQMRAPTIAMGVLSLGFGMSLEDAGRKISSIRTCTTPNLPLIAAIEERIEQFSDVE